MSISYRKYKNYDEYLKHQAAKLTIGIKKKSRKFLPERFGNEVRSFEKRIGKLITYIKGEKVLCMGARIGAEVVAFNNLGFPDTSGIDINPGKNNKYVIKGDFHHMPYPDNNFSSLYCNCIDHSWDLADLSKEMERVLEDDGVIALEIDHLKRDKGKRKRAIQGSSKYESVVWDDFNDIKNALENFELVDKFASVHPSFFVAIFRKNNNEKN